MVGSTSPITSDHIWTVIGRTSGVLMNNETTSSSNDTTMAKSSPDSTAGRMSGNTTRRKAVRRGAPSVRAAASSLGSIAFYAADTVMNT